MALPRKAETKSEPNGQVLGTRKSAALVNSRMATIMSLAPTKPSAAICVDTQRVPVALLVGIDEGKLPGLTAVGGS